MKEQTQIFAIELTMAEQHWLCELIEAERDRLEKSYQGESNSEDREMYYQGWMTAIAVNDNVGEILVGAGKPVEAIPPNVESLQDTILRRDKRLTELEGALGRSGTKRT